MTPLEKLRTIEEEMDSPDLAWTDCGDTDTHVDTAIFMGWLKELRAIREEMEKERAFLEAAREFCAAFGEPPDIDTEGTKDPFFRMIAAYRALEGT